MCLGDFFTTNPHFLCALYHQIGRILLTGIKMFQIKVNKILLPTLYHSLSDAIAACKNEEKRSAAVFTEIIKVF